jgi:hypothetical protein
VAAAAAEAAQGASNTLAAAGELARMAEELSRLVGQFDLAPVTTYEPVPTPEPEPELQPAEEPVTV